MSQSRVRRAPADQNKNRGSPAAGQTTGSAARGTLYQSVQLEDSSIKMLQFVELV